jgi:D-erythronate 2-dehydrogenase
MIREPLAGREAVCPVSPDTVMALASPRRIVAGRLHAHDLPADAFAASRSLQLPGFSVAVGEMADRGPPFRRRGRLCAHPVATRSADPADCSAAIWMRRRVLTLFVAQQADHFRLATSAAGSAREALGFAADTGIDEAVQAFIEDDLEMQKQLV